MRNFQNFKIYIILNKFCRYSFIKLAQPLWSSFSSHCSNHWWFFAKAVIYTYTVVLSVEMHLMFKAILFLAIQLKIQFNLHFIMSLTANGLNHVEQSTLIVLMLLHSGWGSHEPICFMHVQQYDSFFWQLICFGLVEAQPCGAMKK